LYGVAVAADSSIMADAWSSDFADMVSSTDSWSQAVNTYITGATNAFTTWASTVADIEEAAGLDLVSISNKVEGIVSANTSLVETLTQEDGVLDAMNL
jgi:hypothetical protein